MDRFCYWQAYLGKGTLQILGSDLEQRSVRHTLACLLARAVGRSPLEYLSRDQKSWQVQTVLEMLQRDIATIPRTDRRVWASSSGIEKRHKCHGLRSYYPWKYWIVVAIRLFDVRVFWKEAPRALALYPPGHQQDDMKPSNLGMGKFQDTTEWAAEKQ